MPQPDRPRILLTLGRLPKGLELARALSRAGCRVCVADPFSSHLSRPSRHVTQSFQVTAPNENQEAFFEYLTGIIAHERIDLVVPVSEEALHVSQLTPEQLGGAKRFGPDFPTLSELASKLAFVRQAEAFGLSVPESHAGACRDAMRLARQADYVVKPIHGSSGLGLKLRHAGDPLQPDEVNDTVLVQRRIDGRHVSSFTMARNGKALRTVTYEGGVMSGTTAVCFVRVDDAPSVRDWVSRFVSASGYNGFISFDFILSGDGTPYAIECNPRLTSGVHFVEPDDLAAFVLGDAELETVRLKRQRKFQEGHTTLTEAYGALFGGKPGKFLRDLGHLFTSKDVLFELRDPLPFLLMTPMSWPILKKVMFKGRSFGEAATEDIQWTPEPSRETAEAREVRRDAAHAS